MTARVDNCCGDPSQCWEPCGILGKDAAHVRVSRSRFYGASRPATELSLPYVPQPRCRGCDCAPGQTCFDGSRKVGWLERLISGPQGDPSLREDFLSFLGCLACGIGLALVFLAIILAVRVLLGGQL